MNEYLFWSGLVLNAAVVIVVALFVWVWFIWPAVEAISMVRYYCAIARKYPDVKLKSRLKLFVYHYEVFGRSFESVRCNYGTWSGVGKWHVK